MSDEEKEAEILNKANLLIEKMNLDLKEKALIE